MRPAAHKVELADVESLNWNGKKGKIGFLFHILRFAFCEIKDNGYIWEKLNDEPILFNTTHTKGVFLRQG